MQTYASAESAREGVNGASALAPAGDKTVIVIAHHQAVMGHAGWIIDLGPAPAATAAGSTHARSSS